MGVHCTFLEHFIRIIFPIINAHIFRTLRISDDTSRVQRNLQITRYIATTIIEGSTANALHSFYQHSTFILLLLIIWNSIHSYQPTSSSAVLPFFWSYFSCDLLVYLLKISPFIRHSWGHIVFSTNEPSGHYQDEYCCWISYIFFNSQYIHNLNKTRQPPFEKCLKVRNCGRNQYLLQRKRITISWLKMLERNIRRMILIWTFFKCFLLTNEFSLTLSKNQTVFLMQRFTFFFIETVLWRPGISSKDCNTELVTKNSNSKIAVLDRQTWGMVHQIKIIIYQENVKYCSLERGKSLEDPDTDVKMEVKEISWKILV